MPQPPRDAIGFTSVSRTSRRPCDFVASATHAFTRSLLAMTAHSDRTVLVR